MPSTASKSYNAGDVILECKPLIHIVDNEFKGKHCDNCLNESNNLKKCAKCHQMYYCGKDCQQNDWKYHKSECKVYRHKNFSMERSSNDERILLRLWLCIQTDPEFATTKHLCADGRELSLNDLDINLTKLAKNEHKMENFEIGLGNFIGCNIPVDRQSLFRWYGMLQFRWAGIPLMYYSEDDLMINCIKPVGFGLFIGLYDVRHSCVPNASNISDGLSLQMRALKPIEANDKITITFTDLKLNKSERQRDLKERFGFTCNCDKCRLDLDKDIDYYLLYCMLEERQVQYVAIKKMLEAKKNRPIDKKYHNLDYYINYDLYLLMKAIYGQYFPYVSQTMVLNFICFALSKHSEKSMIKLWHKEVEDSLRVTHDPNHPIYKIFNKVYDKSI